MQYEIINKATGEIINAVLHTSDTTDPEDMFVLVQRNDTNELIRFENDKATGELVNEMYVIRQAGTHTKADGTGTIEITENGITDSEGVVAPTE